MWSAVVFEPALPVRRIPDKASPVPSRKHSNGWYHHRHATANKIKPASIEDY
jgi:hypothetical protein